VTLVRQGYFEPATGFAFTADGRFIVESAMKAQLRETVAERYQSLDFAGALPFTEGGPRFLVSNQRTANYCRWWLDHVAKYFIFSLAHGVPTTKMRFLGGKPTLSFQRDTLSVLRLAESTEFPEAPLLRGDFYITSGLTFKGGQNISEMVNSFRQFVLDRFDAGSNSMLAYRTPRRIYISRAKTRMRRVINEGELQPILERNGFETIVLEDLSVAEQIAAFRTAEVIVSPHGAGLTNMIFSRPGIRILEIFPQNGLHPSAFMRLATLSSIDYGYLCADGVETRLSEKTPVNADIFCPVAQFEKAVAAILPK
jgi:hypothetical protein